MQPGQRTRPGRGRPGKQAAVEERRLHVAAGDHGDPAGAASHERAYNWYGGGLRGGGFTRPTLIGVGDGGPERVDVTPAGRGGNTFVFEVASSGNAGFDAFMLNWIRNRVRLKGGGSVQVAFGRP